MKFRIIKNYSCFVFKLKNKNIIVLFLQEKIALVRLIVSALLKRFNFFGYNFKDYMRTLRPLVL